MSCPRHLIIRWLGAFMRLRVLLRVQHRWPVDYDQSAHAFPQIATHHWRMVFLDHAGPTFFERKDGLRVGPHPHIGLQWMIKGEALNTAWAISRL